MSLRLALATPALYVLAAFQATCHEFWIEPLDFQIEADAPLTANFVVGQEFKGGNHAYFRKRTARFDLIKDGVATEYEGRMGDVPALHTPAPDEGLLVIAHQTVSSTVRYKTWEKFQMFADHKNFPNIRTQHVERGLPVNDFAEKYTRFAKSLIAVGSGSGKDLETGLETEFVAQSNPYTDDLSHGLGIILLYQGKPRAIAQVEVFERDRLGHVSISLLTTDADGKASIPVKPGHTYLLDAVVLRPMPPGSDEVWESLWASLTFQVP